MQAEITTLTSSGREFLRPRDYRAELARLPEAVIFNCTGLGSHTLFDDQELMKGLRSK